MGIMRLVPSSGWYSSPVKVIEFATSLHSLINKSETGRQYGNRKIGLAISGGVDSMALAVLCAQLQTNTRHPSLFDNNITLKTSLSRCQFQAFVVDHGVRQVSSAEAKAVSQILERRGIKTTVLKVLWGDQEAPTEMKNFESMARKYRFRLLGEACKDFGINTLLLGHHQDDQVETMIMRMVTGHQGKGVQGMKGSANIPECYGMHGVHDSGGIDISKGATDVVDRRGPIVDHPINFERGLPCRIEFGGIKIYRPLLSFSKARLTATCTTEGMEWFEDMSNKDPTLTKRNAIRHMYGNHAIPAALSKPALLAMSQKLQSKARSLEIEVNHWLAQSLLNLDTRAGTLRVRFAALNTHIASTSDIRRGRRIAATLLQRLVMMVTPAEHVNISSFHSAVEHIFPALFLESLPESSMPQRFTTGMVLFEPLKGNLKNGNAVTASTETRSFQECEWMLSRQLYMSSTLRQPSLAIPAAMPYSVDSWTAWTLFDGRFWVRFQNTLSFPLVLRPFRVTDIQSFKKRLSKSESTKFSNVLRRRTPRSIRWTLPAIVFQAGCGEEKVLALPTLDVATYQAEGCVRWEVRYKAIDHEGLPLRDIVGWVYSRADIGDSEPTTEATKTQTLPHRQV